MWGSRNKIKEGRKTTTDELGETSTIREDATTSFLTSSFYGCNNINKTTANIPLIDLANENVTVIPEFDSSVESDYSPSTDSDKSDSDWEVQSKITSKVSGVKRRCSQTKKPISKKRKVSDAKKSCSNIKGITSKGLARPRERPKKEIKLSDDRNRDLQTFFDASNSTNRDTQTESSTVDSSANSSSQIESTITAAAITSAAFAAAAPAATAAAPASAAAAAASSGENDKPASAAADAASSGVTSAASAAPDAVDSAENSSSQNEITITAAAAVTSAAPAAPAATAAPASAAAASSAPDDTPKFTKKSRVKTRNPKEHFNEMRKTNKNKGLAYKYKVKGNKELIRDVAAKKVGPPCECQKNCFVTLGEDAINTIFDDYWGLASYNLQTADLQRKIVKEPIKRKRTRKAECYKSGTYKYFVYYDDKKTNVCKRAFLSIHAIGKTRVKIAYEKKTRSGALKKDQRGKNPNPMRISGRKLECVHEDIQNLEVRSSHHTRF